MTDKPLHVAISLGNADVAPADGVTNDDIARIHLDLARGLLQRGHVLVYGGDLKPTAGSLTEQLIDMAAECAPVGAQVREHPETCIRNAVAWPIHLNYSAADLAPLHLGECFESYDPPASLGLDDAQRATFVPPDTPERRLWWSQSFSAMRAHLDTTIDARIVVCGRGIGSSGAVPGIFEETVIAARQGTPLFLIGGFGGVAVPLIETLRGGKPEVFSRGAQEAFAPLAGFYDWLDAQGRGEIADFDGMMAVLQKTGVDGLHNGMSKAENDTLFRSGNWAEVSALLYDGLAR